MMKTAISLYLGSRNCYQALREYLYLPCPDTIKIYFGILDTRGSVTDCRKTAVTVFNKPLEKENIEKSLLIKFTRNLP